MTSVVATISTIIVGAALITGMRLNMNAEAERQIMTVLTDHYRGRSLSVEGRSDFPKRWDYQFYYQGCFDLVLDGSERRIVMVEGDDDGGSFGFGREYQSMRDCEAHFNRG